MSIQVRVINPEGILGAYGYSNDGFNDNVDSIHLSWTYQLLTETEQSNLNAILKTVDDANPKDLTYEKGWELADNIYSHFIRALGYKNGEWKEREGKSKEVREVVKEYYVPGGRVQIIEIKNNE